MKTRYDLAAEKAREAIEELRLASYEQGYKDATHDLTAKAPKSSQDIRDEIIEKAKRDIADRYAPTGKIPNKYGDHRDAEFIVNKEKRTVIVILREYMSGNVYERGIAKADPSDCFNVHIGKAIALRHALGLEVPAEYLNVPQPTEVRVGDVVSYYVHGKYCGNHVVAKVTDLYGIIRSYDENGNFAEYRPSDGDRITDDSRE